MQPAFPVIFGAGDRPSLDLNFAAQRQLDPRITFTRASTGTFINAAGQVESAGNNVARFTHDPVTGQSLGLLIEESRTNLLLRSEEFDNASWTKTRSTISANSAVSPDGASTADKIVETAATGTHDASQQVSTTPQQTLTLTLFVKSAERTRIQIRMQETAAANVVDGVFNLSAVTATPSTSGTASGASASMQALPNGWFRLTLSGRPSASTGTTTSVAIFMVNDAGANSYTGDGTSGILIWGAQLEAGAFATSYIPTTGASATRAADLATISGTNFSSWYRQDQGTLVSESIINSDSGTRPVLEATNITNGDGNGQWARSAVVFPSGNSVCYGVNTSVQASFIQAALIGATQRLALAYATNNYGASINGSSFASDTSASLASSTDRMMIGRNWNSIQYLNGTISRIRYWPRRLPDSRLQTLTA